jgi:uncharacterized protein DUF3306
MSTDDPTSKTFSLRRWSQRKLQAARAAAEPAPAPAIVPVAPPADARVTETSHVPNDEAPALPPIESLTIDSDFTAFLEPKVDEALKRKALRQLFRDPRFNVMDGLDVYIDDYSQPDPISPEIVRQMVQGRYIFDPPKTRVNEQGAVEDVPPDDAAVAPQAVEQETLPPAAPGVSTEATIDVAAREAKTPAATVDATLPEDPEKPEPAPR